MLAERTGLLVRCDGESSTSGTCLVWRRVGDERFDTYNCSCAACWYSISTVSRTC